MQCCDQVKYGKVLNLLPDNAGNMYFRGEWNYNPEYNTGDVVICRGKLYLARKHHAGKDPSSNPKCWKRIGTDMPERHPQPERVALYGGAASLRETVNSYEIQLRIDSALNWEAANPLLGLGEAGIDITHMKFKVGNGIDRWNTLPYMHDDLYMLLSGEQQERIVQATDIKHQLEDDELYVTQELTDLKQLNRVLCSGLNDLEYKRLLYEHKITQQLKTERASMSADLTEVLGLKDDLNARLDAVIGQFTEDSEILDARVDTENEVYPTAGANIRKTQSWLKALYSHSGELQEQINEVSEATLRLMEMLWETDTAAQEAEDYDPTQSLAGLYRYIQSKEADWAEEREALHRQIEELSKKVETLQSESGNDRDNEPEQVQEHESGNKSDEDNGQGGNDGQDETEKETDILHELSELLHHRYTPHPTRCSRHREDTVKYRELIWILGYVIDRLKVPADSTNSETLAAIQANIKGLQEDVKDSQAGIKSLQADVKDSQTSIKDLQEGLSTHQTEIKEIADTVKSLQDAIESGEIIVSDKEAGDDEDVMAMIEGVFAGELDGTDIEEDGVIAMLDDVFAGKEELRDGDTDEDFTAMLDEVFGTD